MIQSSWNILSWIDNNKQLNMLPVTMRTIVHILSYLITFIKKVLLFSLFSHTYRGKEEEAEKLYTKLEVRPSESIDSLLKCDCVLAQVGFLFLKDHLVAM